MLEGGQVLENIDFIIFATGYKPDYPFLEESDKILVPFNESKTCWGPLYLKMFSVNEPEAVFMELPFPVIAIQSYLER